MNNLIDLGNAYFEVKIFEEIIGLVFVAIVAIICIAIWIKSLIEQRQLKKQIREQKKKRERLFNDMLKDQTKK